MADGKMKTTTVPDGRPGESSESGEARGAPLGGRVFRPRNIASFLLALAVLYLVYRQFLGLDWREAWASVRGARACFQRLLDSGHGTRHVDRRAVGTAKASSSAPEA